MANFHETIKDLEMMLRVDTSPLRGGWSLAGERAPQCLACGVPSAVEENVIPHDISRPTGRARTHLTSVVTRQAGLVLDVPTSARGPQLGRDARTGGPCVGAVDVDPGVLTGSGYDLTAVARIANARAGEARQQQRTRRR
jgi:hypothetical protein